MSSEKTLTKAELELTQKIQLHFPKLSKEALDFWNGCKVEILKAKIIETFGTIPISVSTEIDPIIRIDRTIPLVYPDFVKEVIHKDLELIGLSEFNINQVGQWRHPEQEVGGVKGQKIYEHMKENNMLKNQFGLAELLAIQAKGIAFFRQHFANQSVYGWKSIVQFSDGSLNVPCLVGNGDGVIVSWYWLGSGWDSGHPALYFAS
jgi:hypothetical protein